MNPFRTPTSTPPLSIFSVPLLILCVSYCGAGPSGVAHAEGSGPIDIDGVLLRKLVAAELPSLEQLYTHLHQNPELSLQEERTAARMAKELREVGCQVTTGVGGHGVVGVLENGRGPVVLLRADIDALPITELTDAPYASKARGTDGNGQEVGIMHACGHDVHMTSLIGAARMAKRMRRHWSGTLIFVAQPAEEAGRGAKAMVADGLYSRFPRPDFALSVHTDAGLEAGKVGFTKGPYNANITGVDITVRGVGGHGAYPHKTRDPVLLASKLIVALQSIVSREVPPTEAAVVTVGSIHGGTRGNIIPEEVKLQLTVRTHQEAVRQKVVAAIERITRGVAEAAGVPENRHPQVSIRGPLPAVLNDDDIVDRATAAMKQALGEENVVHRPAQMGGDDFSIYGNQEPRIPSFMFRLGTVHADALATSPDGGELPGLHSPNFLPHRGPTLRGGVLAMSAAFLSLLGR